MLYLEFENVRARKQLIIALYFEFDNVLIFITSGPDCFTSIVLCSFLVLPCVGLWHVNVAFSGHTHLLVNHTISRPLAN